MADEREYRSGKGREPHGGHACRGELCPHFHFPNCPRFEKHVKQLVNDAVTAAMAAATPTTTTTPPETADPEATA